MAHHPSQRRNLEAPQSIPTTPNPDLIQTYKPSFLVKHMSSLNLAPTHKTHPPHKHSPLVVPEKESVVAVAVKRTHKEKPQRSCLELERRKLGDPKGVVEDVKVEKEKPGNPCLEKHDGVERMSVAPGGGGGRRRSFCGSQTDLRDVFAINGAKMVSVDMPPFMQIHAVNCARNALDSMEKFTSKTLALSLKKEFDGVYGPAWHCIVGTSFGSFVTHSVGGFLYFSMDQKLYILLFKTAVQKAG
ncbi:hypothetical protein VNO80_21752 [Phaseolus coccineus]|uniref:Dynein light chain n=1 Tax=Phaseolus coccineus TaxID=3886 RepID=A0AAN9QR75_PHACN